MRVVIALQFSWMRDRRSIDSAARLRRPPSAPCYQGALLENAVIALAIGRRTPLLPRAAWLRAPALAASCRRPCAWRGLSSQPPLRSASTARHRAVAPLSHRGCESRQALSDRRQHPEQRSAGYFVPQSAERHAAKRAQPMRREFVGSCHRAAMHPLRACCVSAGARGAIRQRRARCVSW